VAAVADVRVEDVGRELGKAELLGPCVHGLFTTNVRRCGVPRRASSDARRRRFVILFDVTPALGDERCVCHDGRVTDRAGPGQKSGDRLPVLSRFAA
jgi:hypothetical protein